MSTENDPQSPLSNTSNRKTNTLLPRYYRTDSNKKFLSATLDQLVAPGAVKKLTGFIGRQNAKAVKSNDVYVFATDNNRQNYQLEPAAVVEDFLGNVTFYKDYIDHLGHIDVNGGITANHERLNKQEFYSWNPHICWDKFTNFQQYYWLPYGPDPITLLGQQREIQSTYTVTISDEGDNWAFVMSPDGLTRNPVLTLYKGQTYIFEIDSPGNPFTIKTTRVAGQLDKYLDGVSASSVTKGTITFTVGQNAPDTLFYVSEVDANTGGQFLIRDIDENAFLDINADLLGKKTYTLPNGISLTNGMKVKFEGQVTPEQYSEGYWFIEGVGSAIKLIKESDLEIISGYSQEKALLFDDDPFDREPFSTLTAFPKEKDYIVINRSSPDRNQWSRYNRWYHQDAIKAVAEINGTIPEYDQTQRANRPIIEFESGLKLFNFGHISKANVDLVDNFTTDVFSTIEGSLGYNIDGINIANGMRILFTADTDRFVKNKIFKVNFVTVTNPGRQIEFNAVTGINLETDIITCSTPHGLTTGNQVTYLTNGNTAIGGLVNRKFYYVSVINNTQIRLFTDKTLINKVDFLVLGNGVHKFETFTGLSRQINLVEEPDGEPLENETVLIKYGRLNQGRMYWFNGSDWKQGQHKEQVNQPPLFDIFDNNGVSYGDINVYDGSNFTGNKVFSYKVGTGTNDPVLNFPLTYKNISNSGDIVFEFNLLNDSFNYKEIITVLSKNTDIGFVKLIKDRTNFTYENGWLKSELTNSQGIVRTFKESNLTNNFPIDVFDFKDQLEDLDVKVYVNGLRKNRNEYSIQDATLYKVIRLNKDVSLTDVVTLKCYAKQHKNTNGYYEIPLSLQNNPLNENVSEFTLGQVIDHVDSIVENLTAFSGVFPGDNNLRDLGRISAYGTRFVQHSGPMNLSLYHFGSQTANVLKGLNQARLDYGKFKRAFITFASESGIDTDPRQHVDFILQNLSKDKTKTQPYYLSDMFAYTGSKRLEFTVIDGRIKTYPLSKVFSLNELSNKAVYIYLNEVQLVHGRDYYFGEENFFTLTVDLAENDIIEVFEYDSTDGAFCPATPSKLGLYPTFEPQIYVDDSYLTPTKVIQGHDGSITIAFDDYRDELILELEKRIFNNIKVKYDSTIFDIWKFIPGYSRQTNYSKSEFDRVLSQFFFDWTLNIPQDYTKQDNALWNRTNAFTWNYRDGSLPNGQSSPAFWRGVYRYTLDTDRPHTHPWEILGFSIKPKWWDEVYGPAPYTKNNNVLWTDLQNGFIREPGKPLVKKDSFVKDILSTSRPVDESGNLLDPYNAEQIVGFINPTPEGFYTFGDSGPVENAWRRSSYYAFALLHTALLLEPNQTLGSGLDRSRIKRNLTGQLVYTETEKRIRLKDIAIPSTALSQNRILTSGLINYVIDYITSDTTLMVSQYQNDLLSLTNKIGSKLGGFTSKEKFRLVLDSKSISSSGGVFVPEENYKIVSNTSSPIKKVVYSGVVITKYADGYEVRGYSVDQPYFTYYPYALSDRTINVGGISESYVTWDTEKYYAAGKIVFYGNQYYRVKVSHKTETNFQEDYYVRLPSLPMIGGRDAELRKYFNTNIELRISYGTKFSTIQQMVDFLQGYGAYLEKQGFIFDEYNTSLKNINNWETAVKEFLFWTTQNWSDGAVLSLSPAANNLMLRSEFSVVADVTDNFLEYKIFRVDGQKLDNNNIDVFRENNDFILTPTNTNHGIYGASLYLIQKEHVLLLDNETLFNDVIYDQEPGYRQERIKVIGYLSTNWNGGYTIPGFVYDQASVSLWEPWTDYNLGDIVKYKEFYYSASKFLPGSETFVDSDWILLEEKPEARLLPNWEYKTMQFTDFYSLDSDNFDVGQQKMAQHLIGYQKRQYLENIIQDDVSQYKFYQGMIIEKGTQNVFNKLFDVLSADDQESLTFNEEWAIRVGNYGASDSFNEIEFKLDENKFKLNPQPFELVSTIDPTVVDFVYRQVPSDIYIKPVGYNNNPWSSEGSINFLRTPGFVRYDEVAVNIDSIDQLVNYNIDDFNEGDYIWCAFEGRDWNIYRLTKTEVKIENLQYTNNTLFITTDRITDLKVNDVIGLSNVDSVKGFYKIKSVSLRNIQVDATIANWQEPFVSTDELVLFLTKPIRTSVVDEINQVLPSRLKPGEQVWVDDNGAGSYAVYTNNKVFTTTNLTDVAQANNRKFGKKVAMAPSGQIALVQNDLSDRITVYAKDPGIAPWQFISFIDPSTTASSTSNLNFGKDIVFSSDGQWLAITAPTATNVQGSGIARQGYVGLYARTSRNSFDLFKVIPSQDPAVDEYFGAKVAFAKTGNNYILSVSATGHNSGQGRVYFYRYSNGDWNNFATPLSPSIAGDEFGKTLDFNADGSFFVVSAPGHNNNAGRIYLYKLLANQYVLHKTIDSSTIFSDTTNAVSQEDRFGESVALSKISDYLAVGAPLSDKGNTNVGRVYIFKGSNFDLNQVIYSQKNEKNERFGLTVLFIAGTRSLVIFSAAGDIEKRILFDTTTPTTFDNNALNFVDKFVDTGRVDIYDRINDKFIYAESLDADLNNDEFDLYGHSIAAANNLILIGAPNDSRDSYTKQGKVYSYARPVGVTSWSVLRQQITKPNVNRIKKAFIYNRIESQIASYIDVVDPTQGKIPGPADQEISYKTFFDPAIYSVGTSDVNVDDGLNWTKDRVGALWWDLTRAKFIDNQAGEVVYRSTNWNRLYETASIDIYEWVESKYLPSRWNAIAASDEGEALGVTGQTKYGDSVYSVKKKYDPVSKTFSNTYYYWVKNPTVVPNVIGRSLSAFSVSRLISDPVAENYTCLALTGPNSFSLVNAGSIIEDTKYNLSVQYWMQEIKKTDVNSHSQWKIVSEHPNTIIPVEIERKWIHSLIGKDETERLVPDLNLPFKQRYGINYRPRQSMFVNRVEALKQFIERTNKVLLTKLIADDYDLSDLESYNKPPSSKSGIWDVQIDTDAELRFVGTATVKQAVLEPVIENGRIVNVLILEAGRGYVYAPIIQISSLTGKGAVLRTVINEIGQVTEIIISNKGEGYLSDTSLFVRPFTVLVLSDSNTLDKWSTYYWESENLTWSRVKGQSYDVKNYWKYVDWYASGYSQFSKIDHIVDNTYELALLESSIGSIVKVSNVGSGGWLLLEKYNDVFTIDYTENYKVVGRQNGTIQFLDNLYNFGGIGYDTSLFDSSQYDNLAETELRIIIDTIKNKLFVDELRVEYLRLFFASIRYALKEQTFIDWAFKTSFVKATHNVGSLKKKVNYNNDNLENFEDYVREVKPYKTQIREFVSSYTSLETASTSVTDFDILPVINERKIIEPIETKVNNGIIEFNYPEMLQYPWKHWYDNVGFKVVDIKLVDGGSGYITNPQVKIEGGFGSGATAKAYVANGKVNRIQLITSGKGYLKAPLITIEGGKIPEGRQATASLIIESEVVRSNKITIAFDRITRNYYITEIDETETFVGTGSKLQFSLKWSPETKIGTSQVKVNGVDVLRDEYSLSTKVSTDKGFTSYSGILTLETAPDQGAVIEITYRKNFVHLSATDRINFYYNPQSGQFGKDLSQLITGIDYGGVSVTGLGFNISGGWDSLPWFTDNWDGFDATFDDYIVVAGAGTYEYTLPYVPAANEKINVYVNGVRIDDPYYSDYDGVTVQPNGRKIPPVGTVMDTIVGDGLNDTFVIPDENLTINNGDRVIFRRESSDGSFDPLPNEFDTQLSGGNLAYSTATGLAPDDIILDGDGLVTPTTSAAPEEIVPGQVNDAVAIKVYQLPTSASSKMSFINYVADGITNEFNLNTIPANTASVFVKVGNNLLKSDDYVVDWRNQKIILSVTPASKEIVSVIIFGVASQSLLDANYFISDGETLEYVTDAPYLFTGMGSIVLVDGMPVDYELFRTNEGYSSPEKTGIRFGSVLPAGTLITYMLTGDNNQSASIIKRDQIIPDGIANTFNLPNVVGDTKPLSNNVLVLVNENVLAPSETEYFVLSDNNLSYRLLSYKSQPFIADPIDYQVYLDGELLNYGSDYVFDVSVMSVEIKERIYNEGSTLAVVNLSNSDYNLINNQIVFTSVPADTDEIEIISFYKHDVREILRTNESTSQTGSLVFGSYDYYKYKNLVGGQFDLERMVAFDDYVLVIKNGKILTHSVDYALQSNLKTIKLKENIITSDIIDVVCFTDQAVNHSYGYMIFKDMLNRYHYKRISKAKSTKLAKDLKQGDAQIQVVDGSVLTDPNPSLNLPGIIEINGERIEFFVKNGNVLSQLRRGTLGTGAPTLHRVRSLVLDIGPTETIPYQDRHIVETRITTAPTSTFELNYNPVRGQPDNTKPNFDPSGVKKWFEYYGLNYRENFVLGTTYSINDVIEYSGQYYKAIKPTATVLPTDPTYWQTYTFGLAVGQGVCNEVEIFAGGYRMKKQPYTVFDSLQGYPYSPEGDVILKPEFSVESSSNQVNFSTPIPADTKVIVVKKVGKIWNPEGTDLTYIDNEIANFIKNTEAVFSQYLVDKYQYVLATDQGDTLLTDDNEPLELD